MLFSCDFPHVRIVNGLHVCFFETRRLRAPNNTTKIPHVRVQIFVGPFRQRRLPPKGEFDVAPAVPLFRGDVGAPLTLAGETAAVGISVATARLMLKRGTRQSNRTSDTTNTSATCIWPRCLKRTLNAGFILRVDFSSKP